MFCSPCPTLPRKGHRRALTLPRTHSCECAWGQGDGLDTTSGGPSHGEATQFKCLDLEVSGEPPGLAWLRPRAGTDGRFLMSPRGQSQSQRVWFPAVFLPPSPFFFSFFPFFPHCLWGLSCPTRDLTQATAAEAQRPGRPNHWTASGLFLNTAVFVSNGLPLMVINTHTEGLLGILGMCI